MSISPLQNLTCVFARCEPEDLHQQSEARHRVFQACGEWYQQMRQGPSGLNGDLMMEKAEHVADYFKNLVPEDQEVVLGILSPFSKEYQKRWHQVCSLLRRDDCLESEMNHAILKLEMAHRRFTNRYIEVWKTFQSQTREGAELNCPTTLELCYRMVLQILADDPRSETRMEQLFQDPENQMMRTLCYQMILGFIQTPDELALSEEKVAKDRILSSIMPAIASWKGLYAELSLSDQKRLAALAAPFSDQKEEHINALSSRAFHLYSAVHDAASQFLIPLTQTGEMARPIGEVLNAFVAEDMQSARELAENETLIDLEEPVFCKSALERLRLLSPASYARLRYGSSRLAFLPEDQSALTEKIAQRRYFYRVEAILALAQSIQNQTII